MGWSQRLRIAEWLFPKVQLEKRLEGGQRLEEGASEQILLKQETDC